MTIRVAMRPLLRAIAAGCAAAITLSLLACATSSPGSEGESPKSRETPHAPGALPDAYKHPPR